MGGHIGGLTLDSECLFLPDENGDGGAINNGLVYLGKNGFSLGGNKLVYNALTDILTFGADVKLTWDNIDDADTFVTQITQNTIQTMEITATKLNIDKINANNGLTGLKLAGFTVTDTSLYNKKESLLSNDIGCYIGTDGIAYSGTERHFKVNSDGDVVADRILSSDGVQLVCHNTTYTTIPNNNVVFAYLNTHYTNIYGGEGIQLIPGSDTTSADYRIIIDMVDSLGNLRPFYTESASLGSVDKRWNKIYCKELICDNITGEINGSSGGSGSGGSSGGSGGISSGDTLSNIKFNGKNYLTGYNAVAAYLYFGGNWNANDETYYICSDGSANLNNITTSSLTVNSLTINNSLSDIKFTGKNYLNGVSYSHAYLYLGGGTGGDTTYYICSDGSANLNNITTSSLTVNSLSTTSISTNDLTVSNPITVTLSGHNYLNGYLCLSDSGSDLYYLNYSGFAKLDGIEYNSLTQTSSIRFKEKISYKDNDTWHDKLMGIKPCTFNYLATDEERIGVIAEDLYEVFPELVKKDSDGLISSVSYVDMIIPLVSEVQRLNGLITEQQNEINKLKSLTS